VNAAKFFRVIEPLRLVAEIAHKFFDVTHAFASAHSLTRLRSGRKNFASGSQPAGSASGLDEG
jgi:hypothetical protein